MSLIYADSIRFGALSELDHSGGLDRGCGLDRGRGLVRGCSLVCGQETRRSKRRRF